MSAGRDAGSTKFGGGGDAVHAMAIGAAGTKLAVGGKSKHIIIYNVALAEGGAAVLGALELTEAARVTPMGTVLALAFDSLAEVLAVGGEARVVQVWLVPGARPPPAPAPPPPPAPPARCCRGSTRGSRRSCSSRARRRCTRSP